MRADTRQQHREFERLEHIIIGAGVEPAHLVRLLLRRAGEQNDRCFNARRPHLADEIDPIAVRQMHIKQYDLRAARLRQAQALARIGRAGGVKPRLPPDLRAQFRAQIIIIVDDKNMRRSSLHAGPIAQSTA